MLPLDLHVLSLSLAFILSQDQTLRCKNFDFADYRVIFSCIDGFGLSTYPFLVLLVSQYLKDRFWTSLVKHQPLWCITLGKRVQK